MLEKLLSDKIEEFIKWLRDTTDFTAWHESVQYEVHKKLIEIMTEAPSVNIPNCICRTCGHFAMMHVGDGDNYMEAIRLLDLIDAEFRSDPMSVQCFDLRIVERVKQCVQQRKRLERKGEVPPILTGDGR